MPFNIKVLEQVASNNPQAAYKTAIHYFGHPVPEGWEQPTLDFVKGRHYMDMAATVGHRKARDFLFEAWLTGKGGYQANYKDWYQHMSQFAEQSDGIIAYNMAKIFMGEKLFPNRAYNIPLDMNKAQFFFEVAANGDNDSVIIESLHLLTEGVREKKWQMDLTAFFHKRVEAGCEYAALWLSWYLLPEAKRDSLGDLNVTINDENHTIDAWLSDKMTYLGQCVEPNIETALLVITKIEPLDMAPMITAIRNELAYQLLAEIAKDFSSGPLVLSFN